MKMSTNTHYRREDWPLVPISVFSGVPLVGTAAFDEFTLNLEVITAANRCSSQTNTRSEEETHDKVPLMAAFMPRRSHLIEIRTCT
jgi:hypothetical protein